MLVPALATRVEQGNIVPRQRIGRGNAIAFVLIAEGTCQPEVILFCQAAERFRNKMVNLHRRTNDGLRCQAITAAVMRRSPHLLT